MDGESQEITLLTQATYALLENGLVRTQVE